MLAFLDPTTNTYQPWMGQVLNGVYYPPDVENNPDWTITDLNSVGLYPVIPFQTPADQQVTDTGPSYSLDPDGQHVDQTYQTEALPAPQTDLINATDDSDAASQGVSVGQFYRNGSQVMVRVS